jgi:cytochrome c556
MMFKRIVVAGLLCLFGATAVVSAENMKDTRVAAMKKIGGAMGTIAGMAKGEKPYDADAVKISLTTISETIKVFPSYFPAGSEKDDEAASPEIWANMDDFKVHAAKLGSDADMLLAQLPADQAALGAAMGTLGGDCGGCHKLYRLKK